MFGAFIMLLATGTFSSIAYGVGKIHGYDKWDRENEEFQKGLNKRDGI